MNTLWPRLERPIADVALSELRLTDPSALSNRASFQHPGQTFASTGGRRATRYDIEQLRTSIVDVAEFYGFPDDDSRLVEFDRVMAGHLMVAAPMNVGEALNRAVWSFMALVVAPDVTYWRFGRRDPSNWNVERWICTDRTRHMFSRLWWQARQLTTRDADDGLNTSLLEGLSESELNHLTERTSIGGCKPLALALSAAVCRLPPVARQRQVVRQAALLLLRKTAIIDPYSLSQEQLDVLATDAVAEALRTSLPLPIGQPESQDPPKTGFIHTSDGR